MYLLFKLLAWLRRSRAVHPKGVAYSGTVTFDAPGLGTIYTLGRPYAVTIRFSRSVGLPDALPDISGIAVKVTAPGIEHDYLFATCAPGRLGKYLLLPTRYTDTLQYSCGFPYLYKGNHAMVGAVVLQSSKRRNSQEGFRALEGIRIDIQLATMTGTWQRIGTARVGIPLPQTTGEPLRYNPWNAHQVLKPTGILNSIRRRAYPGSQAGRLK